METTPEEAKKKLAEEVKKTKTFYTSIAEGKDPWWIWGKQVASFLLPTAKLQGSPAQVSILEGMQQACDDHDEPQFDRLLAMLQKQQKTDISTALRIPFMYVKAGGFDTGAGIARRLRRLVGLK